MYRSTCTEEFFPRYRAFLEIACKKGDVHFRESLAKWGEDKYGRTEIAIKHWKLAASAGSQKSLDELMKKYREGLLKKDELTQVLRDFKTSSDSMKSHERDEALLGTDKAMMGLAKLFSQKL